MLHSIRMRAIFIMILAAGLTLTGSIGITRAQELASEDALPRGELVANESEVARNDTAVQALLLTLDTFRIIEEFKTSEWGPLLTDNFTIAPLANAPLGSNALAAYPFDYCLGEEPTITEREEGVWPPVMYGTIGSDIIRGTAGGEIITAGGGDDKVCGEGGDDSISASSGNDMVAGGDGPDYIGGGDGNDWLTGSFGDDEMLSGGSGEDTIYGYDGMDTIRGGEGNDFLVGDGGVILGSGGQLASGDDTLTGNQGADTFYCGPGVDTITDFNAAEGDIKAADCENF